MTRFTVTITGSRETQDVEQAIALEREVLGKFRRAVDVLPGLVTEARFVGDQVGELDLLAPAEPIKVRA